jgi:glycosyltransferase involved in cell wall biosynthesis
MPRPWPILLLVRELGIGGCERDVTKVATRLDRSRFSPRVGCAFPDGFRKGELEAAGIPIVRFAHGTFLSRDWRQGVRELARYLNLHQIRLVHTYDCPMNIMASPVAKSCHTPVIIASQLSYRSLNIPKDAWRLRFCDQLTDRIVVNCKAVERHMLEDEKVPAARLFLCYNGVDTTVFQPGSAPRPAPLSDASLVIGSVCALRPEKRLDLLIEAFRRVQHLRTGLKLAIVGSGSGQSALRAQIQQSGLEGKCHLEPATNAVADWLRAIDIFVLPSSSESFSNALLEAMACGCCVAASRIGGTPELVEHGERGLLFDVNDADQLVAILGTLIQQEGQRHRLAAAAARFARETFPIERAVARMQSLYEEMLKGVD